MSDVRKFCSLIGVNPPPGYNYVQVWWKITKHKRFPRHPDAKALEALGLKHLVDSQGQLITPKSCIIHLNE